MDVSTEALDEASLTHALVATAFWLGVGAALDVYLIRSKRSKLISDVFRTKPGKIGLAVFCLHVGQFLGKLDPFSYAGDRIKPRPVIVETLTSNTLTEVTVNT